MIPIFICRTSTITLLVSRYINLVTVNLRRLKKNMTCGRNHFYFVIKSGFSPIGSLKRAKCAVCTPLYSHSLFSLLRSLLHLYSTSKYFKVPKHGSPNTVSAANMLQCCFSSQASLTILSLFLAEHVTSRMGAFPSLLQIARDCRP